MRIGFLCSEYPPDPHGGIGAFTRALAEHLATRGHEVFIAGFGTHSRVSIHDGVTVASIERTASGRIALLRDYLRLARFLSAKSKEWSLDLLEVPDYRGESAFLTGVKCPVVMRCHGSVSILSPLAGRRPSRLIHWLEGRAIHRADACLSVSRFLQESIQKKWPSVGKPIQVVPNFVDTKHFRPVEGVRRDSSLVLFVGRMTHQKGFPLLAECTRRMLESTENVRFCFAGGDNEGLLERFAAGLSPCHRTRIDILGIVDRDSLPALYSRASILMLPTRAETSSLVCLEAMACGCVPAVMDASGPAEYIRDGVNGFILSGNTSDDLEPGIQEALERAASVREAARESVVSGYSADVVVAQNETVYTEIVGRCRGVVR